MLAARLKRSTALQAAPSAATTTATGVIIPIEGIRAYLETHPLIHMTDVTVPELQAAFEYLEADADDATGAPPSPQRRRPYDCTECGAGYVELDARNGQRVCTECGLVQGHYSITTEVPWVPADSATGPGYSRVRGVEWSVRRAHRAAGHTDARLWDELQHMNHYTNHSDDTLQRMFRRLKAWKAERRQTPDAVRIVALLLHPLMRSQFMKEADFRNRVQARLGPGVVSDPTPPAQFRCDACGASLHRRKDARYHCRKRKR